MSHGFIPIESTPFYCLNVQIFSIDSNDRKGPGFTRSSNDNSTLDGKTIDPRLNSSQE